MSRPKDPQDMTPAERAGATPLDPERLLQRGPSVRARPPEDLDDSPLAQQIIRRRRKSRSGRRWFIAAAVLATIGLIAGCIGLAIDDEVDVAVGAPHELVLATPVASARRVPEFVSRPVAARKLNESLSTTLASAPPQSCVQIADSGVPVVAYNGAEPLVPASNMKLLTASVAVDLLGADARLSTRFVTDGAPTDGATVKGNLYMIGGGDPLLTTDRYEASFDHGTQPVTDFEKVADQIVDTGIRHITGSVIGDASRYDDQRGADSWPDRYFTQGQVGRLSALMVDDAWIPGSGPVENPALHAVTVMTELLEDRGVTIDGSPGVGKAPANAAQLVEVPSLTIADLAAEALRFSDNTTTEILLKELGFSKGKSGSTAAGIEVVRNWIESSPLPVDGLVIADGSGLSGDDRLTCGFLSSLLASEGSTGAIANGLAVPGQPGTLDERFLQEPLRSSIRAKTGSLRTTTSLSGWLVTTKKRTVDFSILINTGSRNVSSEDKDIQTKILNVAMDYPDGPAIEAISPLPPTATGG